MSQVTITRVFRKSVETKYGIKPKLSIQTNEHGDKWLTTFKTAGTEGWNEGDTVNIDIQEKGDFINFTPSGASRPGTNTNLEERVKRLEDAVFGSVRQAEPPAPAPASVQEDIQIDPDDLPDFGDGF